MVAVAHGCRLTRLLIHFGMIFSLMMKRIFATMPRVWCVLMCVLAFGCQSSPKPSAPVQITSAKNAEVQRLLMGLADNYMVSIAEAFDAVIQSNEPFELRMRALKSKYALASSALTNATNPNALAGLMDLAVLTRLNREVASDAIATERWGAFHAGIVKTAEMQEQAVWKSCEKYLSEEQLNELRNSIDTWRAAHPDARYVVLLRLNDLPQARQSDGMKGPSSIFQLLYLDPLSNIDPAIKEIEQSRAAIERMFFYLQRFPILLHWNTEALIRKSLNDPLMIETADSVSAFALNSGRFADACIRFADSISQFRKDVPEMMRQNVTQLGEITAREREAALNQAQSIIAKEREAIFVSAGKELSIQTRQTLDETSRALSAQREAMKQDMEKIADHVSAVVFRRAVWFVVICAAVFLVAATVYRKVIAVPATKA